MNLRIPAALAAVAFLAACGSSGTATPEVTHSNGNVSGVETLYGTVSGVGNGQPKIPVTASGVIADQGFLILGPKKAGDASFNMNKGTLLVHHSKAVGGKFAVVSDSPCRAGQTLNATYKVLPGGTGPYKNASGSGKVTVTASFAFHVKNGKCSIHSKPVANSGKFTFKATGPFTEHK